MKKIIHISIFIFSCLSVLGQEKNDKDCGPAVYLNTRSFLQNDSLNHLPFDAIVHINIRGWGTATFINDSTLITARHLADKKRIKNITIYKNIFKDGTVENIFINLTKEDFKIKNAPEDNCHFISSDISFVVLHSSGQAKAKEIYTDHMEIADYITLNIDDFKEIILSGYPVDLAASGLNNTDILSNKRTRFKELLFDKDCKMVGYKIFTCSGDSGAPLWVEVNGKFYVIAIHHGGPERGTIFNDESRNSAALVRKSVLIYDK
jgi:V8-like Glu-specific endopeptidase